AGTATTLSSALNVSGGATFSATTTTVTAPVNAGSSAISISGTFTAGADLTGNVTNSGILNVFGSGTTGILTITGDYTQTSSGSLLLDIGGTTPGTGYDRLAVTGTA